MVKRDPKTFAIIGAAMEVHQTLGYGFLEAQVIKHLKATGLDVGLLINFGAKSLQYKRCIFSSKKSVSSA